DRRREVAVATASGRALGELDSQPAAGQARPVEECRNGRGPLHGRATELTFNLDPRTGDRRLERAESLLDPCRGVEHGGADFKLPSARGGSRTRTQAQSRASASISDRELGLPISSSDVASTVTGRGDWKPSRPQASRAPNIITRLAFMS